MNYVFYAVLVDYLVKYESVKRCETINKNSELEKFLDKQHEVLVNEMYAIKEKEFNDEFVFDNFIGQIQVLDNLIEEILINYGYEETNK